MTPQRLLTAAASCVLGLELLGCAPPTAAPNAPSPHALASSVVWTEAAVESGSSAAGTPIDVLPVVGGDIVRIQTRNDAPLAVGERTDAFGRAESWSTRKPHGTTLLVRVNALAKALLLPHGASVRVYRGHGSDPGYYWFALEDRVLDWARGPLPAPFPQLAPSERVDYEGFASLDRALTSAVAQSTRSNDLAAARAVRAVAGLRAVRALRPPTGLPYFFDSRPSPVSEAQTGADARPSYGVTPNHPLEFVVQGPALLHVWLEPSAQSDQVEVKVLEASKLRAHTQLPAPRAPMTHDGPVVPNASTPARRALVQVPPGTHRYRVESSEQVRITPLLAQPIEHLEEAAEKNETTLLKAAQAACDGGGSKTICAFTLALLGRDLDGSETSPWSSALATLRPEERALAEDLAAGGPRDPAPELDRTASGTDATALERLSDGALHSVDERTRAAWVHASTHGTEWQLAASKDPSPPWISAAAEASGTGAACTDGNVFDASEVGNIEQEYSASPWHGAQTVELLVVADCADPQPVELIVDGERIRGNPSARVVRWRVRVRAEHARIQRVDHGSGRVFAFKNELCRGSFRNLQAPTAADGHPTWSFDGNSGAVGLEVWLRAGANLADVSVSPAISGAAESRQVRLVAPRAPGWTAYDAAGVLWTRVGRFALPPWANHGVRVSGTADVALRALLRVPKKPSATVESAVLTTSDFAKPLDETELVQSTRSLLNAPPDRRGSAYLRRGLMLAAGGAERAALADARAAHALGARGPHGEDALELVRGAVRPAVKTAEPLPMGVNAYGINPDFDPRARRCQPADGARAELEQSLDSPPPDVSGTGFDLERAIHASMLADALPLDPRVRRLVSHALKGSRWKLRRLTLSSAQHMRASRHPSSDAPLSADGELRPSIAVGAPFESGTYVTVRSAQPARAVLSRPEGATRLWVDVACAPRDPVEANGPCPLDLTFASRPLSIKVGSDGRGRVELPNVPGSDRALEISLQDQPGDWVALARISANRALPDSVQVAPDTWAIAVPDTETRTLLRNGATLPLTIASPALLRIDARSEGGAHAELTVRVNGQDQRIPASGASSVPVPEPQTLSFTAQGGAVSFTVADRVPADPEHSPPVLVTDERRSTLRQRPVPGLRLDLESDVDARSWFETAAQSPPPLTPLESALGTFVAESGVVLGRLRRTPQPSAWKDAYAFELLGYRRRIESLGLWTRAEAFSRTRLEEPTYGAEGTLYESLDQQHFRLTATLKLQTQQTAGLQGKSVIARGFVEYSQRVAKDVFVLPRLGYDGMYSSIARQPTRLSFVDDEVYNPYRSRRPTFLFGQALFWYAPYFNEILALRLRATLDAKARALSHSAAVWNGFFAFGNLDLSGQAQAIWYVARDSLSRRARVDATFGASADYSFWSNLGSLAIIPGISGELRPQDGAWQVSAFVNVLASFRRGLRDFSSLELDFPEQLSGGIPWRGTTPGGYR